MISALITIPNIISFIRILLAPLLLTAALTQSPKVFLWGFALSLLTDFLDGFFARLLNQMSKLGSQLDTIGDVLTGIVVWVGGILLWPKMMMMELPWIIISVAALSLSGIITLVKYHHLPSYHTWSAKLSTAVLGLGVWFFFAGKTPWGLRVGVIILTVSAIEEIAITILLPEWRPNVPHVFKANEFRKMGEKV